MEQQCIALPRERKGRGSPKSTQAVTAASVTFFLWIIWLSAPRSISAVSTEAHVVPAKLVQRVMSTSIDTASTNPKYKAWVREAAMPTHQEGVANDLHSIPSQRELGRRQRLWYTYVGISLPLCFGFIAALVSTRRVTRLAMASMIASDPKVCGKPLHTRLSALWVATKSSNL